MDPARERRRQERPRRRERAGNPAGLERRAPRLAPEPHDEREQLVGDRRTTRAPDVEQGAQRVPGGGWVASQVAGERVAHPALPLLVAQHGPARAADAQKAVGPGRVRTLLVALAECGPYDLGRIGRHVAGVEEAMEHQRHEQEALALLRQPVDAARRVEGEPRAERQREAEREGGAGAREPLPLEWTREQRRRREERNQELGARAHEAGRSGEEPHGEPPCGRARGRHEQHRRRAGDREERRCRLGERIVREQEMPGIERASTPVATATRAPARCAATSVISATVPRPRRCWSPSTARSRTPAIAKAAARSVGYPGVRSGGPEKSPCPRISWAQTT